MGNDDPATLAARSVALLLLAIRLRLERATLLYSQAGTTTWVGPTPSQCLAQMNDIRRNLGRAADDLEAAARRLDRQAHLLATAAGGGRILAR